MLKINVIGKNKKLTTGINSKIPWAISKFFASITYCQDFLRSSIVVEFSGFVNQLFVNGSSGERLFKNCLDKSGPSISRVNLYYDPVPYALSKPSKKA